MVSYVAFVFSLFVPNLSYFWCLRRAVLRVCGISWVSSLFFCSVSVAISSACYHVKAAYSRRAKRVSPIYVLRVQVQTNLLIHIV